MTSECPFSQHLLSSGPEEPPSTAISCLGQSENGDGYKILSFGTKQQINCRKQLAKPRYCSVPCLLFPVFWSLPTLLPPGMWNQNIREEGEMCELFSFQSSLPLLRCICYPGLLRNTLPFSCSIFHFCLFLIPNFIFSLFSFSAFLFLLLFLYISFLSLPALILLLITHLIQGKESTCEENCHVQKLRIYMGFFIMCFTQAGDSEKVRFP